MKPYNDVIHFKEAESLLLRECGLKPYWKVI